jgi:hypothetical protein
VNADSSKTSPEGALHDPKEVSPVDRGRKEWLLKFLRGAFGRVNYERVQFRRHVGYFPNLQHPATFNEKVAHRKLFDPPENASVIADKVAVRDHVARVAGEKYLTNALMIVEDASDIDFDRLPGSFAAKASHGSAMNLLVPDKSRLDVGAARARLSQFLGYRFGKLMNEEWYDTITPRILIESFLHDEEFGVPLDLKCFVFHGHVETIRVVDRFGGNGRSFYDAKWTPQQLEFRANPTGTIFERPKPLDEVVAVAETLSQGLDFVRVDLYCVNDRDVIFGEMTLAPGSGWSPFRLRAYDEYLGSLW